MLFLVHIELTEGLLKARRIAFKNAAIDELTKSTDSIFLKLHILKTHFKKIEKRKKGRGSYTNGQSTTQLTNTAKIEMRQSQIFTPLNQSKPSIMFIRLNVTSQPCQPLLTGTATNNK